MKACDIHEALTYERVEPFLPQRIDYWFKELIATLYNINRASRNSKVWRPSEFNAPWEEQPKTRNKELDDQIKDIFGIPK